MTIATLVYALVFGALVAVAAAALDACLRLGKRATRGVWIAALGVTIAGTALAPARTIVPAGGPVTFTATTAVPQTPSLADHVVQSLAAVRYMALRMADRMLARIPAARTPSVDRWLTMTWFGASLAVLVLLIAVHAHFRRARRAWPITTLDGTTVRLAPRTGPAVIGLLDPEIVLPAWLMTRARDEQRLVLDHEREHLRAHDPLVLAAAYVAAALMPWHPAVWWMLARLRLAVELDCDTRVLRRGVPPASYGALLIDLAGRSAGATHTPALGLTLTNLERRLIAMTPHHGPRSYARRGVLGAAALLAFAIACNAPVPTSPHRVFSVTVPISRIQALPDRTAGLVMPGDSIEYHIDGALASAVQAESLSIHGVPRTMLVQTQIGENVRKRVEFWITTRMKTAQDLVVARDDPRFAGRIDRPQALHEKIQVDSAMAARMPHAMLSKVVPDRVLIDGRPATISALKQLLPDHISRVEVMKNADSTKMISVTTKRP